MSERPHRVRTWAPRGQTPILQYTFNWKCLSAIAGITLWNFYFQLFPGSIKAPQVITFLRHLRRHIPGPLTVIWDGWSAHRSRLVREFVAQERGAIALESLPAYAPELNPVEYIWGYCKTARVAQLLSQDLRPARVGSPGRPAPDAPPPARRAHGDGTTLREAALALGDVSADDFDRWVDPASMVKPSRRANLQE